MPRPAPLGLFLFAFIVELLSSPRNLNAFVSADIDGSLRVGSLRVGSLNAENDIFNDGRERR
jgi:hypothetical protein